MLGDGRTPLGEQMVDGRLQRDAGFVPRLGFRGRAVGDCLGVPQQTLGGLHSSSGFIALVLQFHDAHLGQDELLTQRVFVGPLRGNRLHGTSD